MQAPSRKPCQRGFTLVELILVIVVTSVMAATLVVFFKPAMEGYIASRSRAELADQADTALRRMVRDVRAAVPNSIRSPGNQCFELVPSSTGGRYRTAVDTARTSYALDPAQATTEFDVLTPLSTTPAVGDWVVVGNQNPADLYGGATRARISAAVTTPAAAVGRHHITIDSTQFPPGSDSGRFTVVPNSQRAVFYVCSGADGNADASGNGKGTLFRLMNYAGGGFNSAYPASCPATTGAAVLARYVKSCNFIYDPAQGATQQNGFVWMQLELMRGSEAAHLTIGAHVDNTP